MSEERIVLNKVILTECYMYHLRSESSYSPMQKHCMEVCCHKKLNHQKQFVYLDEEKQYKTVCRKPIGNVESRVYFAGLNGEKSKYFWLRLSMEEYLF